MSPASGGAPRLGVLLSESVLDTPWFAVLATFVAINTLVYVALSVTKILPRVYVTDWVRRRYRRAETRSIHPENEATPSGRQVGSRTASGPTCAPLGDLSARGRQRPKHRAGRGTG